MKAMNCLEHPIRINGLLGSCQKGAFHKLPDEMFGKVSEEVTKLGHRANGGRIRFRTDASVIEVQVQLKTLQPVPYFSLVGCAGCAFFSGLQEKSRYLGPVAPPDYDTLSFSATFHTKGVMEDYTLYLPRNEYVEDVNFSFNEEAVIEEPSGFAYEKPLVFYGSSITEGCSAVHTANSYPALVSRWFNMDYVNLGFSGAARGELPMAEFIRGLSMEVFIFDYDHNAPSTEYLQKTHEPFFQVIRMANPELPILMSSRPDYDRDVKDSQKRRQIIMDTYLNARKSGDENVYFLDGETLFGTTSRYSCTIDTLHPNDTGMMRIAQRVAQKLELILQGNALLK